MHNMKMHPKTHTDDGNSLVFDVNFKNTLRYYHTLSVLLPETGHPEAEFLSEIASSWNFYPRLSLSISFSTRLLSYE